MTEPLGDGLGGATISRLLLLAALAAGATAQGGFFPAGRVAIAALLAAALVAALLSRPLSVTELRYAPVLAAGALAGWAVLQGLARGTPASGWPYALLLAAMLAVLSVCRRLDGNGRELLLSGLLAIGLVVAATGWVGVAWRLQPWALPAQQLWRAAGVLTYANAAAALLVPLALVALGRLVARPRSPGPALVATGLLVGAGATLSRAGAAGLLAGVLLLAALAGVVGTLWALVGPAVGAAVALAGLLASMPETMAPNPALAMAALAVGLGLAALLTRLSGPAMAATALAAVFVAVFAAAAVAPSQVAEAADQIRAVRLDASSADRSDATAAAVRQLTSHPLTGVGPGEVVLRWTGPAGELRVQQYVHNEYLQVTTELGAIGGALLVALLLTLALIAWRGRQVAQSRAAWAGIVAALGAFGVHGAFDFVWHIPVIPLTAAVLVGVLIPPIAGPIIGPPAVPLTAVSSNPDQKGNSE